MSYKIVYERCQSLGGYVSRNHVVNGVTALPNIPPVKIILTGLDTTKCRGFYLSARNVEHYLVKNHGKTVICIGRGQNRCWTRMVLAKELMHIFDDPEQSTGSVESYESVLTELFLQTSDKWSPQMQSEIDCFVMALGLLCPETFRRNIMDRHAAGDLDQYAVALTARLPEAYIPYLFSSHYEEAINRILK